jgi:hypothetical protein
VYPDKAARREIDSLVVYCANRDMGCDWTGRLASLDTHTTACPHKGVTCPNEGCGQVTAVAKMDLHLVECPFRLVECDYCHSMLPFCQLPAHHEEDCELYPQPCEQCSQLVTRRDLDRHLEESCSLLPCKVCHTLVDRDTTKEVIDGKLGKLHFSDPKIAFEHSHHLTKQIELISTQTSHNKDIEYLKENTVPKTKMAEMENKMDNVMALMRMNVLESGRESEGVVTMKTLLQEMQRTIKNQNRKIEGQARDIAHLTSKLEEVATKGPSNGSLVREDFPRSTGLSTQEQLTSEPSYADSRMLQVMKSVEELQRTTSAMRVHISELELQLQASLASTHTGSFLWRIPEVARRKRDAFEGRITSIYSPPFYSGRNGYKMCIRAYLNGDGIGFNTHLSVFFVLMRGEYDPLLKWPFESKVSLVLVDQSMRQHIIQTFKPSPDSSSFQRPKSDMNVASGCPQFAKLSVLDEGNYIKNDVLFLKCIVDTSKIVHP